MSKQSFKELITHNTFLKVISLIIGFVIWLTVVNISNPEVTESITIPLNVRNDISLKSRGKSFTIDTETVKITYKVRTNSRKSVAPKNFDAYVSLDEISITGAVMVHVDSDSEIASSVSNISVNPMVVHVETEDIVQKSYQIQANITGTPVEGKVAGDAVLNPSSVRLKGPSSEIGKISRVSVDISVESASDDLAGTGSLLFYDSADNQLTLSSEVQVLDTITYTMPIYGTKSLSITAGIAGQPAIGYTLNGLQTSPSFITVYGPKELLDKYNTITIPDSYVDVNDATRNVTVSLNVEQFLPDGLFLYDSGEVSIVANISRIGFIGMHNTQTPGPGGEPESSEAAGEGGKDNESSDTETAKESSSEDIDSKETTASAHEAGTVKKETESDTESTEEITDDNIESGT